MDARSNGGLGTGDDAPLDEGRLGRSWRLTRIAFRLIRSDGTLAVLAVVSALVTTAATAVVFGLGGYFHHPNHTGGHFALVLLIAAWPLSFIATFFNVAIAAAASMRLSGGRMTVGAAFASAFSRVGQIALWSLLATGVGVLLREVASRVPGGGRVASWLLGAAWGIVTLFAIPIIAVEGCSAVGCVRRSAALIKTRWGEGIAGNIAVTAIFTVVGLPAGLLIAFGAASWHDARATALTLIIIGAALLMLVSAVSNAVRQVFAAALYRYAVTSEAGGGFAEGDLRRPFAGRRRRWFS